MRILAIAAALLAATAAPVLADSTFVTDDNQVYRIVSDYVGYDSSVEMVNNNSGNRLRMNKNAGVAAQLWHIHQMSDGSFVLSTLFEGGCRRFDVAFHPGHTPILLNSPNGNSTQRWSITGGNGTNHWRLQNQAVPSDQSIDVLAMNQEFVLQMAPAKVTASQYFEIIPAGAQTDDGRCDN